VAGGVDEFANGGPEALDGSLRSLTQERLEPGDGGFGRIEVGALAQSRMSSRAASKPLDVPTGRLHCPLAWRAAIPFRAGFQSRKSRQSTRLLFFGPLETICDDFVYW
jgi:hypothetical protein